MKTLMNMTWRSFLFSLAAAFLPCGFYGSVVSPVTCCFVQEKLPPEPAKRPPEGDVIGPDGKPFPRIYRPSAEQLQDHTHWDFKMLLAVTLTTGAAIGAGSELMSGRLSVTLAGAVIGGSCGLATFRLLILLLFAFASLNSGDILLNSNFSSEARLLKEGVSPVFFPGNWTKVTSAK